MNQKIVVVEKKELFKLVAEFNAHAFSQVVTAKMADGWQQAGVPFVFGDQLCLAMRKTEDGTS